MLLYHNVDKAYDSQTVTFLNQNYKYIYFKSKNMQVGY